MHPYTLLDVFTAEPLRGNGLAVVHDADGIPDEVMHRFARETRLSETSFVQSPAREGADYRNRIWTMKGVRAATYAQRGPTAEAQSLDVAQGVEMGRPSVLRVALEGDRVRVGGDAIIVVEGTLHLDV